MKKYLSVILTVIMVLAMLVTLSGCTNEAKKFVGTWETTLDMADAINEELASDEEVAKYLSVDEFELVMAIKFNDDGTYKMYVDEDSAKDTFDGLRDEWADGIEKMLEDTIAQQGVNMTVDQLLAASNTTIDDMLDQVITDDMINEMLEDVESEGNYVVKDGKLFMSDGLDYDIDEDQYETYEISDDELKLIESVGDDEDDSYKEFYPMTFTKVS